MNRADTSAATLRQGEDLRIDVPGLTLAARRWGNPAGRPFIALHGWLDNANTWNRLAPLLPELDLVALDFAGHGHSDHRAPGVHYVPLADIQDVIAAADALGFDRFGLIGHSMGGAIASELAGLFPERVTEAVFVDGLVHHQGNAADGNDRNRQAIEQMLRAHEKKPPVYADLEAMARRVTEATDQSMEAALELVARGHAFVEGGCTWRTDPRIRFATPLRITARQIDDLMARTTARCLLLIAREGDRWYRPGVERRAEHHPQLTIRELDGPHHLHLEPAQFEAVAREVRNFLGL
ncbi:MAG: alpha/beta hydrolase [Pseudomonadales bacterium]|jgi:pimeloyl-ACP methyl ester carboxylesterase|nr:alpha/beta hydrolase [Pseudomonadales bacterium]